jgi:hypothetical protein
MQPPENRARACQQSTEDYPQDEQRMQEKDGNSERRIETRGKNGCMHLWNLQQQRLTDRTDVHFQCSGSRNSMLLDQLVDEYREMHPETLITQLPHRDPGVLGKVAQNIVVIQWKDLAGPLLKITVLIAPRSEA